MAKYKKYEKYKDSEIEWIGKVPETWDNSKLKYIVITTKGFAFKSELFKDQGIPIIKTTDIKQGKIEKTLTYIDEELKGKFKSVLLKENDILMSTVGSKAEVVNSAVGQIGKVQKEYEGALLNQNAVILRINNKNISNEYLFHFLSSNNYRKYLDLYAHGTANQASLSLKEILDFKMYLPDFNIQEQIANFLDKKTSEIDSLIAVKEKLINLLEEKRRTIITEAVTKGLNSNVKLKKSGTKWIGDIPEQWNISSVRNLIRQNFVEVQDGNHGELHPTSDDYVDEGIPFVMASDIRNGKIDFKSCKYISKETKEKLRIGFSIRNDVLLTHKGTIGEVGINDIDTECIVLTPQVTYYRIKADKIISNNFLYYYFQSTCIQNQLKYISSMQSTRQYIGIVAQRELIITLPNIEEQITIVDYLKNKVGLLEEVINLEKLQIEKLKEYRQSIISEAVTGKIDVRDYCMEV